MACDQAFEHLTLAIGERFQTAVDGGFLGLTLTVNGVALGAKTSSNHIFIWSGVTLQSGSNAVQAASTQGGKPAAAS